MYLLMFVWLPLAAYLPDFAADFVIRLNKSDVGVELCLAVCGCVSIKLKANLTQSLDKSIKES